MGLFFTSNKNKLSRLEINQALAEIGILESSDKREIKRRLRKRRAGGITKRDVIEVARQLKQDLSDDVDAAEAQAAKRELLKKLDE
jgi:hypothetical protein